MSRQLIQQAFYTVAVSIAAAYVGTASLSAGQSYLEMFQVVGTAAFQAHSGAQIPFSIWFGRSWRVTWVHTFEGLFYAALTAGVFGWLWP